ncbi:MAG TPA: hypothetical protein DCS54_01305, partial [Oribacterium sp.]|nr:hypothetical protein [Oribacterium sp.]
RYSIYIERKELIGKDSISMAEQQNVLLISNDHSFMLNTINTSLTGQGLNIINVRVNANEIKLNEDKADIFILYMEKKPDEAFHTLRYLENVMVEKKKTFIIIADETLLHYAYSFIQVEHITTTLQRPLDMQKLNTTISNLLHGETSSKKSILLVDDDPTYLKMVRGTLQLKYHVTPVNSGRQAIEYLAAHRPDLILLDYVMPEASGPEILRALRSQPATADIPVVFLTGNNDREKVVEVITLKPDGYLLKGVKLDKIVEYVDNFFRPHIEEDPNA